MSRTYEIRRVAATVYDQGTYNKAEIEFLGAMSDIDKECSQILGRSNTDWGVKSHTHQLVKKMVEAYREEAYVKALKALEAAEEAEIMGD